MKIITPNQVRAVHTARSRIGMGVDAYHALLRREFNVVSCKGLTVGQANELLNMLNADRRKPAAKRKQARRKQPVRNPAQPRNDAADQTVVSLLTPVQATYIHDLRQKIVWRTAGGYEGWLKKSLGLTRVRTSSEASDVIRGLKKMETYYPAEDTPPEPA